AHARSFVRRLLARRAERCSKPATARRRVLGISAAPDSRAKPRSSRFLPAATRERWPVPPIPYPPPASPDLGPGRADPAKPRSASKQWEILLDDDRQTFFPVAIVTQSCQGTRTSLIPTTRHVIEHQTTFTQMVSGQLLLHSLFALQKPVPGFIR